MLEVSRTDVVMYGVGTKAWFAGVVLAASGRGAATIPPPNSSSAHSCRCDSSWLRRTFYRIHVFIPIRVAHERLVFFKYSCKLYYLIKQIKESGRNVAHLLTIIFIQKPLQVIKILNLFIHKEQIQLFLF